MTASSLNAKPDGAGVGRLLAESLGWDVVDGLGTRLACWLDGVRLAHAPNCKVRAASAIAVRVRKDA